MQHLFHWLVDSIFVFAIWYILAMIAHTLLKLSASAKYLLIVLIQMIACIHWITTYFFPIEFSKMNSFGIELEWLIPYIIGGYILTVTTLIILDYFHIQHLRKSIYSYHHYPSKLNFAIQKIQSYSLHFPKEIIRFSTKSVQPFVVGLLKPIIVLPFAVVNQLPTATIEWILLHEWIHIKHYDLYFHQFGKVMCRVLFFNPFFKSLNSIREQLMEEKCDECVLHYKNEPLEYSSALLELAKLQASYAYPSFSSKDILFKRIQRINGANSNKEKINWKMCFLGVTAVVLALLIEPKMPSPILISKASISETESNANSALINYATTKNSITSTKPALKNKNTHLTQRKNIEETTVTEALTVENDSKESNTIQAIAVRDTSLGWIAQPLLKRDPIEIETWIPIDYEKIIIKRKKKDGNWETWEILIPKSAAKQKIQIEIPEE